MTERKKKDSGVNAQFIMSHKARQQIQKFKNRLAKNNIKMRVGDIVNLVLEKTTLADFDRLSKEFTDTQGAIEKLRRMYADGKITEEQLQTLIDNAQRRLDSEE